ncbi:MAG: tRNA (adenosine(37)-N6)-threonylcarbamoyltransferase complex dimerization subunit type 1 TsaB [Deltaproteobacteria bacterium]|nr:tRNA (adenosine(37)-N6)-threonylcarbamoyltransferase complex dimerization subunit type 1 TsaB [Deltaproteobacteria bacterium]
MYKNLKKSDFFVLAFDTTTFNADIAVLKNFSVIAQINDTTKTTHSTRIIKLTEKVLARAKIKLSDISGIAVCTGPGSFTGVRIGLAFAKGLAYALQIKIAGITSLQALAAAAPFSDRLICSVIDAQRNQMYFAGYKYQKNILTLKIKEQAGSIEDLAKHIKEPVLFIGDGLIKYKKKISSIFKESAKFISDDFNTVKAQYIGKLTNFFF